MSFQAYLDTIQAKTGLDADALKVETDAAGLSTGGVLKADVKAGQVVAWAKERPWSRHGDLRAALRQAKAWGLTVRGGRSARIP